MPRGPYPVLVVNGEQGSGKTGAVRILRALIDPNLSPARAEPKDVGDLLIAANNGRVVSFDNISSLPAWLSDSLCRIATGAGVGKRALYTDDEEIIFQVRRPVFINGITEVVNRADLLDRCALVTLPSIPDDKRRPEDDINAEFEKVRPGLLGALLTAISCALKNLDSVRLSGYPRMADFARWVVAAEPALPWAPGEFLAAYQGNRESANIVSLEASPLYRPLAALDFSFEGSAGDLLDRLQEKLTDSRKTPRGWPGNARALSNALRRLAPNLRRERIEVSFQDKHRPRRITITRATPDMIADAPAPEPPAPESPHRNGTAPMPAPADTEAADRIAIARLVIDRCRRDAVSLRVHQGEVTVGNEALSHPDLHSLIRDNLDTNYTLLEEEQHGNSQIGR